MSKEAYHPNAYLSRVRNIKRGLMARSRILNVLERDSAEAKAIAHQTGMHYAVVTHHLRLLQSEVIVERKGSKPHVWMLTGMGQKRLVNSV